MKTFILSIIILFVTQISFGQNRIGTVYDQANQKAYAIFENNYMFELNNPNNQFFSVRDPSGQTHLMLPSLTPHYNAFFLTWDNRLIRLDRFDGTRQIGYCDCPLPVNPNIGIYQTPKYDPKIGINTYDGFHQLPIDLIDDQKPYGTIMLTGSIQAEECYRSSFIDGELDEDAFGVCMVENMAGNKELAIFNCVRNSSTPEEQSICLMKTLGGRNERMIASKLHECYETYGDDYAMYPLCMSETLLDEDLARAMACISQQSQNGQISFFGTALCYGARNFDLNPEVMIMIECAIASGGEPYTFASCSGGQLLSRELDKCLTYGIGGSDGCFGENNEIIKGLRDIGGLLEMDYGRNNDLVVLWNSAVNDLTVGPGPNNEAVKVIQNIGNEVGRAPDNIGKAIERAVPKIKISW